MQGPPHRSQQHFHQRPSGHQHAPLHAKPAQPAAATQPTKAYNPRHPERTLLYRTVAEHFETWLELASAGQFDGQGEHHTRPAYVEKAFRKYLECGILPTALRGHGVTTAGTTTWWPFPAKAVVFAPRATRAEWPRPQRIFLRAVQQSLQTHCPSATLADPASLHLGAATLRQVMPKTWLLTPMVVDFPSMPGCVSMHLTAQGWSDCCVTVRAHHSPWTGSNSVVLICSTAAAKGTQSRCSPTNTRVNWFSPHWS